MRITISDSFNNKGVNMIWLIILLIIAIICFIIMLIKYIDIKNQLYEQNDMYLYYKNKISMIEYQYRNYKEGMNAFTVLRNMASILKDFYR